MFRQARQSRVFQDVVFQIEEAILEGRLGVGDRLPSERELVETFHISRGTLREALRVLEQKGLIEIRLGVAGGAIIKGIDSEPMRESLGLLLRSQKISLDHLGEFREGVEGHVAALAAERATPEDIVALEALLAEAQRCILHAPPNRDAFIRADEQLHMALADIAGNEIYRLVLQTIHQNISRYYDQYLSMELAELEENYRDLCDIVAAVAQKQPPEANRLAQDHVRRFNRYMKTREQLLRQQKNG